MKIYNQPRGTGKTYNLILRSSETQTPILVATTMMRNLIEVKAKEMGVVIPSVWSFDDIKNSGYKKPDEVLVDELEMLLNLALGTKVKESTMTGEVCSKVYEYENEFSKLCRYYGL